MMKPHRNVLESRNDSKEPMSLFDVDYFKAEVRIYGVTEERLERLRSLQNPLHSLLFAVALAVNSAVFSAAVMSHSKIGLATLIASLIPTAFLGVRICMDWRESEILLRIKQRVDSNSTETNARQTVKLRLPK